MAFLSLRDVTVELGGLRILEGVGFDVAKGEIVSIIGPNGAGKTTLIKALLGLVPYSGKILMNGKPISSQLGAIGYVPQRFEFDKTFPISVREFLDLFPQRIKIQDLDTLCKELHLLPFIDQKLGDLSGGQLQRVLIAQALLKNPTLLILDEPTSGVDVEGVKNFYEIVEHLNREHGVAVLLISHELTMVFRFATKVVCLNRNLVCFGDPATALTSDVVTKLYGENLEARAHRH